MLLHQKKPMSTKNLFLSIHEEWETHGQSFTWQTITKLLEQISSKVWENWSEPESGPERGGIGSVVALSTTKKNVRESSFCY